MAKILVMPDGNWLSHVSRPLEIALVLRELGHEVEFAGEGAYMKLPREKGFRISPAASLAPGNVLKCSRSGRVNWWDDRRLARSYQEDLRVFEETKPDMVLADFRLSLSTSCDVAEIPLVVTLNAAWTDYYSVRTRAPEHLAATRILGRSLANFGRDPGGEKPATSGRTEKENRQDWLWVNQWANQRDRQWNHQLIKLCFLLKCCCWN